MAFKLGDLFWKIKGDTQDIDKKLGDTDKGVEKTTSKFGKLQGLLGKAAPWIAAGAAALALGKKILSLGIDAGNAADRLLDLTEITGLNTDTLQELQFIAANTGVNFDGLTGAVQRFTAKIPDLEGTSNVADAFNALGVNLRDSNGEIRDSNELFPDLIKALQNIENTTERNSIAQQLFGRSLQDLAPVIGLTNDQFDGLRDKAEEAGVVIGKDALDSANEFRAGLDSAKLAVSQAKIALGSQFAPVLQEIVIPVVETAANIINGLAKAIGSLNDLLMEPTDRADQIAREIDFYQAQIEKVSSLTMLNKEQRQVLLDNYNASIYQLQQELRGLALKAEAEKTATEEKEANTEAIKEQTESLVDQDDATQELTSTGQHLIGQALVPITNAEKELWRTYGEGVAAARSGTQELAEELIDVEKLTTDFIESSLSGFQAVGAAIYNGADAASVLGAAVLSASAQILSALGAELAARAAVAALAGDAAGAVLAGAGAAAAFTASGVIGAAASDISSTSRPSAPPAATSTGGTTSPTTTTTGSRGGGGGTYNITINNLISTGKEADIRAAVRAQAPWMVEEVQQRLGI